jgi:hypothetical protein
MPLDWLNTPLDADIGDLIRRVNAQEPGAQDGVRLISVQ